MKFVASAFMQLSANVVLAVFAVTSFAIIGVQLKDKAGIL